MKKTRINLIVNREDYHKTETFFSYLKLSIFIIFILFLLVSSFFLILFKQKNNQLKIINLEKQSVLRLINENSQKFAQLNYLRQKYKLLKTYIKDDANSSPYYSLLNEALKDASNSAQINEFNIDKDRRVDFTIAFSDFPSLRNFFKIIESQKFLKNFESIYLRSFNVIGATIDRKENYELSFYGKFIPINKITKIENETETKN
jgi:hypothetical protein